MSGFSPGSLISQSYIAQYTGDNGLISNAITSVVQAKTGFIWITSYNGIMRFDGQKVDVFDRTKIPFLTTDAFYKAYLSPDSSLWFASQGSGIVVYKNSTFKSLDSTSQTLPRSVRCLLMEPDGGVWAGANNAGLFFIKKEKISRIDYSELNTAGILDLAKDKNGVLWIATDGEGLYSFDGKALRHVDGLLSETVNTLMVSHDNTLVIGTTNGLNLLKGQKLTQYDALKNYQINALTSDGQSRIWVGTELGLARISLVDDKFEFLSESEGYPLGRITGMYADSENSLWVSTGRNGLIQIRESSIINFTTKNGLSNNKINVILEGPERKFYIGSDAGAIDVYQNGEVKSFPVKLMFKDAGVRDLLIDKTGTMWIASYKGLLQIEHGREKLFTEKDGLPAVDLRRIIEDHEGNIWVASRSAGIAVFRKGKINKVFNKTNGLKSNYVLALEENQKGEILAGTHSGGLSIINKKGEVTTYHIGRDDSGILIFNIHTDESGKVWIVSNIGLLHFDGQKFIPISLLKISQGETFFDWLEDKSGNVWVTSNIGLFRMSKQEILDFIAKKRSVINVKLFDNQDGMKTKECTGATHSIVSSTGKIWVPTIGGVSVFFPEKIRPNLTAPPVYITSVLADNTEYLSSAKSTTIDPGKLRYSFSFTALSFVSPTKIRFRYRLEGVDKDWIDADKNRQADYTNIRPGTYQFRVVACNSDGVWNTNGAAITVTVLPFYYQTYWFYAIVLILILGLLYLIYNWRIRVVERRNAELQKVNSELDRFVYSASHDLRAPLASILGLVNVARLDKPEMVEDYLQKIEISVQKLDGFIRDIIDFSRNARVEMEVVPIDFNKVIHEVIDNLMYLDEKNQIKRIVNVTGTDVFFTDKKRLTIILNNLISNSIKYFNPHAHGPFIEVNVSYTNQQAVVTVRDNGIGIAAEHVDNIFKMFYRGDEKSRGSGLGLYIVKETVDKIKGKISVKSRYGEGSIFTVTLPSLPPSKKIAR